MKNYILIIYTLSLLSFLSGCTVIAATASIASTIVGGAIEAVDAVTPDILDDMVENLNNK
jgi:hypothetical protein